MRSPSASRFRSSARSPSSSSTTPADPAGSRRAWRREPLLLVTRGIRVVSPRFSFVLSLALVAATVPRPAEAQRGWVSVTRRFDAFAGAAGVVGGSAILVRDGRIVARHHYGVAERAGGRKTSDSTIYHWASVTKALTAIAVLQLRDRGLLSLDDPITRWVPELRAIHD